MASNGATALTGDAQSSLEKIKRQLSSASGSNLLQGPLLKRSETLRKWNERWVILDPTTGKMQYKIKRNEAAVKGSIIFDSNSTITISPLNFHGLPKYDSCCFCIQRLNNYLLITLTYCFSRSFLMCLHQMQCLINLLDIGTPQKKEYFLCAETPGAARAWVSTLHATQLVLRAHKEAVNSLGGNGSTKLGTVATVVSAANSTALEATKEIEAAMRISMRAALGMITNRSNEDQFDNLTIMKETLRVKDDELQHLNRVLRARDSTIKEIAEKLTDTAHAAEAAASAAHAMDEERRLACAEIERLTKEKDQHLQNLMNKLRDNDEKLSVFNKEREDLLKQRDSALQEAHRWRSELAKARDRVVILEAAVLRAEEKARVSEAETGAKLKGAADKELASVKEKEDLVSYVNILQAQIQRQESNTKQVIKEEPEASCSGTESTYPLTKHVDLEDDVDKACLSDSRPVPCSGDEEVQLSVDRIDIHSVDDAQWSEFQSTHARIADVREVSPEEGISLDIPVVSAAVDHRQHGGSSTQP